MIFWVMIIIIGEKKPKTFNFMFVLLQSMLAIFSTFKAYIAILYSTLSEFMVTVSEFTD